MITELEKKMLRLSSGSVLGGYYRHYTQEIYGSDIFIKNVRHKKKLQTLEEKLTLSRIPHQKYALFTSLFWKKWVAKRKLKHIPLNVFCGKKSLQFFTEHLEGCMSVDLLYDREKNNGLLLSLEVDLLKKFLLFSCNEPKLAYNMIFGNVPTRYELWHIANKLEMRPVEEAISIILKENNMSDRKIVSYFELCALIKESHGI